MSLSDNRGTFAEFTVSVDLTVRAESERAAWKIIDRILNRDDDELISYTEHEA